jgi:hypothetical protein
LTSDYTWVRLAAIAATMGVLMSMLARRRQRGSEKRHG